MESELEMGSEKAAEDAWKIGVVSVLEMESGLELEE